MSGINNNNNPYLHLNSRRMIQAAPTNEVMESALSETSAGETPAAPARDVDSDIVSWMALDQHSLLNMKNIKIVSSAKGEIVKSEQIVEEDRLESMSPKSGTGGISGDVGFDRAYDFTLRTAVQAKISNAVEALRNGDITPLKNLKNIYGDKFIIFVEKLGDDLWALSTDIQGFNIGTSWVFNYDITSYIDIINGVNDTNDTSDIDNDGSINDPTTNNSGLTTLEDFEEKIKNNELDLVNYTGDDYIAIYSELIRADLKEKYNYSDEYINLLLEFSKNKANWNEDLKELLTSFGAIYKDILSAPYLYCQKEPTLFKDGIYVGNMPYAVSVCSDKNNNMQTQFFAYIFSQSLQNLSSEEKEAFYLLLADKMELSDIRYDWLYFNLSDFEKLNTNGDNSWFDELYSMTNQITSTIKHIPQSEIDNTKTINPDILFKDANPVTAEYLMEHLNELLLSDDPGIRKLAQIIYDNSENSITQRFINNSSYLNNSRFDKQQIVSGILYLLNEKILGYSDKNTPTLNQLLLNVANDDTFGEPTDIFAEIENILSSGRLLDVIIMLNIDGVIDEVDQGATGDCWLLSGIRALVSSQVGKDLVKNAIQWADDKKSVWVYFAGMQQYIQVTIDDIKNAFLKKNGIAYSQGDLDVLVIELAMQKIMGGYSELEGDNATTFWYKFLGVKDISDEMGLGLDDIGNAVWGFITGHGGRQDMDSDDVYDFISKLYQAQQQGMTIAATCSIHSSNDSYYTFTDIYGESHTLQEDGQGGFGNTGEGHEFAILEITATTVTFANPHDSKNQVYTVSWEVFANIGFSDIECAVFKPLGDNEVLKIHKQDNIVYNIDSTGKITTNTPVANYNVPLIRNIYCDLNDTSSMNSMLGGIKIAIKDKLNVIMSAFAGKYDADKLQKAYDTLLDYYYSLLSAVVTARSEYGGTGAYPRLLEYPNGKVASFVYYDYTKGEYIYSTDGVNMCNCSDLDYELNQPYGWQILATGNSGIFVNEYNGRFDIYMDLQTMVNKFMELL